MRFISRILSQVTCYYAMKLENPLIIRDAPKKIFCFSQTFLMEADSVNQMSILWRFFKNLVSDLVD